MTRSRIATMFGQQGNDVRLEVDMLRRLLSLAHGNERNQGNQSKNANNALEEARADIPSDRNALPYPHLVKDRFVTRKENRSPLHITACFLDSNDGAMFEGTLELWGFRIARACRHR